MSDIVGTKHFRAEVVKAGCRWAHGWHRWFHVYLNTYIYPHFRMTSDFFHKRWNHAGWENSEVLKPTSFQEIRPPVSSFVMQYTLDKSALFAEASDSRTNAMMKISHDARYITILVLSHSNGALVHLLYIKIICWSVALHICVIP